MTSELDRIQAMFLDECVEGLAVAEDGLAAMAEGRDPEASVAAVFRAVHSIKGGSGAFGFSALLAFSHRFENVLDAVRDGRLGLTPPLMGVLLAAFDLLSDHVRAVRGEGTAPDDAAVLAELDGLLDGGAGEPEASEAVAIPAAGEADEFGFVPVTVELDFDEPVGGAGDWLVTLVPSRAAFEHGAEPLLVLRELERLGGHSMHVDASALPPLRELDPEGAYLRYALRVPGEVEEALLAECFDFLPTDCEWSIARDGADIFAAVEVAPVEAAAPVSVEPIAVVPDSAAVMAAPVAKAAASAGMTIRVDLAKLDKLLNLVGELVIRNSILADRLAAAEQERVELPQLSRLTRQIQDSVMALRAQPISHAFSRVPRMLRDLERETGKSVRLVTSGEATEVDKTVIERIGDPMTHMIRNAVDHGLESAEARIAAGKEAQGTVTLTAEQKGGRIIVRVGDDGGGIDRPRVLAKAIEKGIVPVGSSLSDEEIDQLICAPGFSTAETVSSISGRGVGMDVVRSNIESLGGRVDIASVPGRGTTFTMILPLTLAILDGMIVRLGGQRYVLPLSCVIESVQPEPGQVRRMSPDSEVIDLRGTYLPVMRLSEVFSIPGARQRPDEALVIIVESDSAGAVGLMVDTIDDRREVVVKSLDSNLHPIRGLGGATVLGDGSIALILDVDAIVAAGTAPRIQKGLAA